MAYQFKKSVSYILFKSSLFWESLSHSDSLIVFDLNKLDEPVLSHTIRFNVNDIEASHPKFQGDGLHPGSYLIHIGSFAAHSVILYELLINSPEAIECCYEVFSCC